MRHSGRRERRNEHQRHPERQQEVLLENRTLFHNNNKLKPIHVYLVLKGGDFWIADFWPVRGF
jgi:hypothetical protein